MLNIMRYRYWYFALSLLMILPGALAVFAFGIPRSIDFEGGSFFELTFADASQVSDAGLAEVFEAAGFTGPKIVQATDDATSATRFQVTAPSVAVVAALRGEDGTVTKEALYTGLRGRFGDFEELQFTDVGPTVGAEVTQKAIIAVALACLGILAFLTLQFRNVPHPIRYGTCAILALIHDVFVVLGIAAIMGHYFGWEVDALFLTALLTVIGFSVHDSIVVFDRIRENIGRMRGVPFERVVNHSVVQTLDRSINTQLTALFTLVSIFLYSQGALQEFVFWLIVGIISGTYSSIFNAAPLLVVWENREWRGWFGRGRKDESPAPVG